MLSKSPTATEGAGSAPRHLCRACMTAARASVTAMFSDRCQVPLTRSAHREKTRSRFGMSGTPESTVTMGIGYASGSARTELTSARTSGFASAFALADSRPHTPPTKLHLSRHRATSQMSAASACETTVRATA